MARKKQNAPVEKRLTNKELDRELSKVKFRNKKQEDIFKQISEQTWFRQYAKGSDIAKNKIIKKVKAGIRHGKFTYASKQLDEESRGFIEGKKKSKGKQRIEKAQKKIAKEQKVKKEKVSRKRREQIKIQERKAPSGRVYSKTEIHEGIKSKRASAYRKAHGIKETDYE